jgi:hypothetical protein
VPISYLSVVSSGVHAHGGTNNAVGQSDFLLGKRLK